MKKIREDAQILINPDFVSDEEGKKMHSATQQAIDSVKSQVEELKSNYKELIDLCQQKRDLFIVCVKFHMTTRQVGSASRVWTHYYSVLSHTHTKPRLHTAFNLDWNPIQFKVSIHVNGAKDMNMFSILVILILNTC